ncbi:Annexin D3 [Hibiscus syriacus]|uniref:Annexin n=1 Tax=Hibiscus syriacus TaxID=106335 RepID=A0A6A3BY03_HIBSY|nr:Annexin D3 [Hibiscus syriacus]
MKSFKKLFTSKPRTHIPESSFKFGGMASLKTLDVVPSPAEDAQKIKNAFIGLGTDEDAIIEILGHRDANQRQKIRETYRLLFNETLIDGLNKEVSGDFGKAVILWTYDPCERDARLANEVLKSKKKGIKHLEVIVEMSCASSPQHLVGVRKAYCDLFNSSLEEDILVSVPMPLRKENEESEPKLLSVFILLKCSYLVGLVTSYRYDKEMVDKDVAKLEANRLHESIKSKDLAHDDVVYILSTRNFYQLRATFEHYKEKHGNPIDEDIMKSGKGDLESLLKMVIVCIASPEKHFAQIVGTAIIGLGTDEDSLTRAIVSRAEIDMMKVKSEYLNIYKSSLDAAVTDDTSGDYRKFLVTLLGGKI